MKTITKHITTVRSIEYSLEEIEKMLEERARNDLEAPTGKIEIVLDCRQEFLHGAAVSITTYDEETLP